jgi:dynactin 4
MLRATSWEVPYVHIECGCEKEWGIEDLYYCYQCSKVLCPYCVNEEIDSFYCRTCMENMPATEANAFKNRCSRCFQCPVCFSSLQVHLYSSRSQKFYHFGCQSCYWDSMNLDLKGNSLNELFVSNQEYFGKDNPLHERFKTLLETYREAYRNRRRTLVRHSSIKETWTIEDLEKSLKPKETLETSSRVKPESLSLNDLLRENLVYCDISSIPQRLLNLSTQPRELSKCILQPMQLLTKRSKRCKTCKKYVVKPETNPSSTSYFKMENLLVNIFPRILIREIKETRILLVLINPNSSVAYARFQGGNVPEPEFHLNSYDPVMDMVTHEGGVNDGLERDKNQVVVPVGVNANDIWLQVYWRFMRGTEHKNIGAKIHIKITNNIL